MVIYKYKITPPIAENLLVCVQLPIGAEILHVGEQRSEMFLWAKVNDDERTEWRRLYVVPTGIELLSIERLGRYLGTVHMHGGELVFHIFEAAG